MLRGAGTRGIPEIPAGSSFSNTKSLEFDGVDDEVYCGTYDDFFSSRSPDTKISISFWFKTSPSGDAHPKYFFSCANYSNGLIGYIKSGIVYFGASSSTLATSTSTYDDGLWHHYLGVWDNLGATPTRLWIDGILVGTNTNTRIYNFNEKPFYLGRETNGAWYMCYAGNLDEFAIWEGDMSGDVAAIYNLGTPNDLTSLSPTAWYRMGENSTFKTPQILMPENTNKDKVSNYSMAFDGVDDSVATGYTGAVTSLSLWFKPDATITTSSFSGALIGFQDGLHYAGIYLGDFTSGINNELITVATNSTTNKSYYAQAAGTINTDWHHLAISHNGTQYNIYLDNINVFTANYLGDVALITATRGDIGSRVLGASISAPFAGLIDEVAIFNYELTPTNVATIWGGGTPNDLTSLSPVAWWRMGEEATFVYNVNPDGTWTIPDQAGSNDGTSNNLMADSARVGTAPSSSNNAVSFNMDAADIDTETPPNP